MNINEAFYCSKCLREMEDEGVCPLCGYDEDAVAYDPQVLEEGTLLGERRYRIGALIGRGGFGMTYAAWDQTLLSAVAIKEYFPDGFARRDVAESNEVQVREEDRVVFSVGLTNFSREAHILAALQNVPHVVKVSNCFEENGTGYIVMEYVRGVTLLEYVQQHRLSSGELLHMLREPIASLALIHQQGVMHRDITPNNLMVLPDGTVKLIDFGAASVDESRLKGKNLSISATKHYAAPEQYDAKLQQGQWTDVYGLSATIYALLTGCEPPDSKDRMHRDTLVPPRKVNSSLSKRQEDALLKGLTVDPENRLRSVDEFRAILYNLPTPEIVRQKKRILRRMRAITAAAVLLTALVIANFAVGLPLGDGLLYSLRSDGWHVMGRTGDAETLLIGDAFAGIPIARIHEKAFAGDSALTAAQIRGDLVIGSQAFYECRSLETVEVADVREIGDFAFAGCNKLHTVQLDSSVETIGEYAFMDAPGVLTLWGAHGDAAQAYAAAEGLAFSAHEDYVFGLTGDGAVLLEYRGAGGDIVLPSVYDGYPVTRIDESAAQGMFPPDTSSIAFPHYLESIPAHLFDVGEEKYALTKAVLGPYVREIGAYAFAQTPLETINFPQGLETIGEGAFLVCNLKEIDLPDSLRSVGEQAFAGTKVERLALPAGVTQYGEYAFTGNYDLKEVIFPDGMEAIPDALFASCSALERVVIPESVKSVGWAAFASCTALEMVDLSGVERIEQLAFSECINLKYVYLPGDAVDINDYAFSGCSHLLVLSGYDATTIEAYALEHGYAFENQAETAYKATLNAGTDEEMDVVVVLTEDPTVIWPIGDTQTNEINKTINRMMHFYGELEAECFYSPTAVVLPAYAERIEDNAFAGEGNLETIVFPQVLEYIGYEAFKDCVSLREIDLPDTVENIGMNAFRGCTSLESVKLPEGLLRLGGSTFMGCTGLKTIEIPQKIKELNIDVFAGTGVEQIVVPGTVHTLQSAFRACASLRSAVLEEGVRKIMGTFEDCAALETVVVPSTVNYMSDDAFAGCASLKDVYVYSMDCRISYTIDGDGGVYELDDVLSLDAQALSEIERIFKDSPDVTIHAYPGSTIEAYANAFGVRFEPIVESVQ